MEINIGKIKIMNLMRRVGDFLWETTAKVNEWI